MNQYRQPAVAGSFYPETKNELLNQLSFFSKNAPVDFSPEKVRGIIAPHAGYIYSAQTAAYAYNYLENSDVKDVIVISPSHYEAFDFVSLYNGDGYETPMGKININKEKAFELTNRSKIVKESQKGHNNKEHALEVHLPFLQYQLKNFNIIPLVIGCQERSVVYTLAEDLSSIIDDKTLIVASTDLSHFYTKKQAQILDDFFEIHVMKWDYPGLMNALDVRRTEACGGGCVVAMLKALEKFENAKIRTLKRSDSSDTNNDIHRVVGYLSALIYE